LPQKRWNVYNRENRFKVAQDEAKAKEAEDAEEERHQQAEREYRHQTLMQRARKRTLGLEGEEEVAMQGELPPPELGAASVDGLPSTLLLQGEGGAAAPIEHINFWKEEEISNLNAQHPEVEAAKLEEARKRGKADFYTMDPKFDERFQLGYQMAGEKPWYAKKPAPAAREVTEADPLIQGNQVLAKQLGRNPIQPDRPADGASRLPDASSGLSLKPDVLALIAQQKQDSKKRSSSSSSCRSSSDDSSSSSSSSSDSSNDESSCSSESSESRKHKRRRRSSRSKKRAAKRSDSRKRKHRSKDKGKGSKRHKAGKNDKKRRELELERKPRKSIEQLRAERLSREVVERDKARLTLMGVLDGGITQPLKEGYNSGYGFAAQIKKHRR